jgi:predicted RNase H-like HicB family nuclease
VLRRAKEIASGYRLVIQRSPRLGYVGTSTEFPGVMADGPTPQACVEATILAHTALVATMLEAGEQPPVSADPSLRKEQINIRVTAEEKLRLEDAAQQRGFRNVSEFLRTTALREASAA